MLADRLRKGPRGQMHNQTEHVEGTAPDPATAQGGPPGAAVANSRVQAPALWTLELRFPAQVHADTV